MHGNEPAGKTLLKGLVAGAVATGAMVAVRDALWQLEGKRLREEEMKIRQGAERTGFQKPVRLAADRMGADISKEQEQRIGEAIAWSMGIAGVVGYAFARERMPRARAANGLAFGAAAWAAEDETLLPLLGLAKGPTQYPWQAHARGLAAHLAYGAAAETALRTMER